jgi:RNA polymerase sigma-70 factor (ECF subfamily)
MPSLEPKALGRLYRQHAPTLRLYARQWGEGSEDLVQEAFVRLAQQSPPPEPVVPWLYCVIRNQALANYRGAIRRRQREVQRGQTRATSVSWFAGVDDQLDAQEATRLLSELTLETREVIVARLWGGLTFAEIAELVGCSLPTAQRRYQTGLTELRERLEGRWTPTHPTPTT